MVQLIVFRTCLNPSRRSSPNILEECERVRVGRGGENARGGRLERWQSAADTIARHPQRNDSPQKLFTAVGPTHTSTLAAKLSCKIGQYRL